MSVSDVLPTRTFLVSQEEGLGTAPCPPSQTDRDAAFPSLRRRASVTLRTQTKDCPLSPPFVMGGSAGH